MESGKYEIRIKGRIGDSVAALFADFDSEVEPAVTILRGSVEDQAALHGVLDRIQRLGLELVEVKQVGGPTPPPLAQPGSA